MSTMFAKRLITLLLTLACCLPARAALQGLVVTGDGQPVARAWVQIVEGEQLLPPLRADAAGRYRIPAGADHLDVRASAPGYLPAYGRWEKGKPAPRIVLQKADTMPLVISIVDENNVPRDGVRVLIQQADDVAQTFRPLDGVKHTFTRLSSPSNPLMPYPEMKTDSHGNLTLDADRRHSLLLKAYYDARLGWVERVVSPNHRGLVELNLGSAADVTGAVHLASGCSLHAGSAMSWIRGNTSPLESRVMQLDADGTFSTSRPYINPVELKSGTPVQTAGPAEFQPGPVEAGQYEVVIGLSSLKTVTRKVELKAGPNQVDFEVDDVGRLVLDLPEGVDSAGAEVRGAGIWLSILPDGGGGSEIDLGCTNIGASEIVFWSAEAGWDRQAVKIEPGVTTRVPLNIRPGGDIVGRWTESDLTPYAIGVKNGSMSFTVRPDASGAFAFRNLPPGEWSVSAPLGKTGRSSTVVKASVAAGETREVNLGYRVD